MIHFNSITSIRNNQYVLKRAKLKLINSYVDLSTT